VVEVVQHSDKISDLRQRTVKGIASPASPPGSPCTSVTKR
jgi:hypothetical protein